MFDATLQNHAHAAYAANPQEKAVRPRDVYNELGELQSVVASLNMTAGSLRERLDPVMRTVAPTGGGIGNAVQEPGTKLGAEIRGHVDFLREIHQTLRDVLDRLEI